MRAVMMCALSLIVALSASSAAEVPQEQNSGKASEPMIMVRPAQLGVVTPERAQPATGAELIIGSGDLLEISVYGAAEFTRQVRVADSGEISLPLMGSVHVAGLTIHQAELLVEKRLSEGDFFNDPQVSILEKEYATQGISVVGEVQKPGIYPLLGSRKLFDAISAAGGLTPKAGNTINVTRRSVPPQTQTVILRSHDLFAPEANIEIFPGDTIAVSKAGIVYVVGDVRQPAGFVMENSQMTVLQAIAMAQGTNNTAKLDKTVLVRKTSDGPREIPIQLTKIMAAKSPDIPLQAEDIVFVPRSQGKAAAARTFEAILQTAVGVAIYRP